MNIKYVLLFSIIGVLFAKGALATDTEIFNGQYHYKDKDTIINFTLDNAGISAVKIGDKLYNKNITYDYLGDYGNTQLFGIKIKDGKCLHNIKLIILHDSRNVLFVSGYYVLLEYYNDVDFNLKIKKTIEMDFCSIE